ncbi:oxidoreductase [Ralstonia pickettii]|uniref:oxidoreductase n=1 Tax=Ralstonia pickettii TaxID=329 RepID=UPI0015F828AB|nr:oxidoreductase [Ralstonia pickettii]MBB0026602.1 oxidoreductase [Ralstonia pickettii]MBB0037390.1 oxidoreductase [Ralstonia pickettii]MBB0099823.1 oxidoreductase [Ralstonia pickettii]MBB0109782.1 oxidoreductase [Ralstonia pickettii]MBB0130704.1 oxidoreductase [Ralstonia pickettii]
MPLSAALVGYGYAGKRFHAALIDATPGLRLQVIGSNRPEAVRADRPNAVICTPEAAATHADVDLVVIAAPNDRHAPLAEAALRAGKHVVVDKPFTVTLAEARHLARVARDAGRVLSVFQNRRWDSDFLAVQAAIGGGTLGEVMHVEAHFDRYRPQVRARWREQAGQGTGIWFDLGPHLIDQALQLLGLPDAVSASFARQRPGAETPDWAHVVLDVGERRAVLHASMLVAGGSPRWIVHGTRGSFVKRRMDQQEAQLLAGMQPGAQGWGVDDDAGLFIDGATSSENRIATPAGDQRAYYAAVRDAIFGQRTNPVPPVQAVAVMAVLEAAVAAAETGTAVVPDLIDAERADWLAARETAS